MSKLRFLHSIIYFIPVTCIFFLDLGFRITRFSDELVRRGLIRTYQIGLLLSLTMTSSWLARKLQTLSGKRASFPFPMIALNFALLFFPYRLSTNRATPRDSFQYLRPRSSITGSAHPSVRPSRRSCFRKKRGNSIYSSKYVSEVY